MKKWQWCVFGLFLVILFTNLNFSYGEEAKIAVVLSDVSKIYLQILEGISENIGDFQIYQMLGEEAKLPGIIKEIKSSPTDLIIVIGNKAAQGFANVTDIPIIFCAVVYPERYGLLDKSNICGIFIRISAKQELGFLKKIAPAVRKIGVMYDPSKSKEIINEAKLESRKLNLEIVTVEVSSPKDVTRAIKELKDSSIDAFWMILDPLLCNKIVFDVLLYNFRDEVFIAPVSPFVERGGLFSVNIDYKAIGMQAGRIAQKIISGEVTVGNIGLQFPEKVELAVNLAAAKKIGLSISEDVIKEAAFVYK